MALRYGLLVPIVAGALLLIAGEFLVAREIRVLAVSLPGSTETAGALHGYALAIIGAAMLPMAFGAVVWRARPAAVALLALALAACAIVVLVDRPVLDDTGLIGRQYELADADPGPGFYVESVGAGLALVGAIAALVLSSPRPRRRRG